MGPNIGQLVPSLPTPAEPANYSVLTFFGNVFFLQTILVPVYGSNGPLWSLAYEFWYYVLFPPLAWAFLGRGRSSARTLSVVASIAIALCLPWEIVKLGLVWLAGVVAFIAHEQLKVTRYTSLRGCGWVGFVMIGAAALSSVATTAISDLLLGLIVAAAIPVIGMQVWGLQSLRKSAEFGAEISYSLYLFHFPLVVAAASFAVLPDRLDASAEAFALFFAIIASAVLASIFFWATFERRTDRFYRACTSLLLQTRWQ